MEEKSELMVALAGKISSGHELMKKLKAQEDVRGVGKLIRKINQEIRFLEKVRSTDSVKREHLQSTNLIHLNALVERLLSSKNPTEVLKPFKLPDSDSRLTVDIICNGGAAWIKVIARNARALTLISLGNGEYGQKSVLDQAEIYLKCATMYPHHYKSPEIIFHFAYGIETSLSSQLEELGVSVEGEKIECGESSSEAPRLEESEDGINSLDLTRESDQSENSAVTLQLPTELKILRPSPSNVPSNAAETLNLDVSTLLAYVSNMTNGYANFVYLESLLTLQAEWERERPLKPFLDELFHGKSLKVCRTAYKNFMDIINIIGGRQETARTHELMKNVDIVEDATEGRILKLAIGGKIKLRSRLVFASGESTKSVTVSANEGFVRAARMQGIECTAILHEPRSLSELKEKYATRIDS
ncbi:UPF0415 protein C7orf25 homolog [Diachasma alloeum]|uniref:UPF0415 protein C7orf25 homolog n=1 Tax=Diachasma alloeum TaxID=454923 RepID=UPI00073849BA|nr:UPF0415 protein C7orf25 homolog [Diachasma alloeum]